MGQAFAEEMGLCLVGMNGCTAGSARLDAWWADIAIDKHNLAWRALTRDQIDIEEATKAALAKASADEPLTAANLTTVLGTVDDRFKDVANLLAKADNAMAAAGQVRKQAWMSSGRLGHSMALFAAANQYVLTRLPANATDRKLLAPMLGFIHANLGNFATRVRLQDLADAGRTASSARVAGQVNFHISKVRKELEHEFQRAGGGEFYKIRGGVIVALLEAVGLLTRASAADKSGREWADLSAVGLCTIAAGFELAATGVESVATKYAATTVVGRGASIAFGGLRLWAGGLATIGGGVSVVLDGVDAAKASREKRYTLKYAYIAHGLVSLTITGLAGAISLSASGAFLRWVLANTERSFLQALLPFLIDSAEALAAPELAALLGLALGWSTVIGLAITVVIYMLAPDALEDWCAHSCLGKRESGSFAQTFKDEATELGKLYEAFQAVS